MNNVLHSFRIGVSELRGLVRTFGRLVKREVGSGAAYRDVMGLLVVGTPRDLGRIKF
jgi:hypothetical protein